MRIALIGHSCSPILGSEPGVTWNWAASLAKAHDVTLLAHPLFRESVEAELAQRPIQRLKIHWIGSAGRLDPWKPGVSERGLRIHYRMYQSLALRILRQMHAAEPFDLVHHVSWASLYQPPLGWKLGLPFVWGPLGGGQTWPKAFLDFAGGARNSERLRNLVVHLTRWNPLVIRAARHSDLILAVNAETVEKLQSLRPQRVEILADYGIQEDWLTAVRQAPSPAESLSMLWGGRCEPRKGLPLILQAMAKAPNPNIRLTAAGDGPCSASWQEQAKNLGLGDRVKFVGRVAWDRMSDLFATCDVLAFPSLRDSTGTIVLEAMSRGMPVLALKHQGVAQIVPPEAGIKIPVTTPDETIGGLAAAMEQLAADPGMRQSMGAAARRCAAENTWAKRAERMIQLYEEILRARRGL